MNIHSSNNTFDIYSIRTFPATVIWWYKHVELYTSANHYRNHQEIHPLHKNGSPGKHPDWRWALPSTPTQQKSRDSRDLCKGALKKITTRSCESWSSWSCHWTMAGPHSKNKQLLYFEWSPPWHVGWRLSGEGCHWEYDGKNGEFENIDFRFPWLSDTSEMGFGHDVPFYNYSDRLPHPSDLCQPDRVRWG